MTKKTALVTGSTDGVGRAVAVELGREGWRVLVHGRNRERGEAVVHEIRAAGGEAGLHHADVSALANVRALASAVSAAQPRLDLLVNNAGIGFGPPGAPRETGADGHELRLTVNYLAPVLLSRLMLPSLKAAAPARIVNIASIGQRDVDFDDLQMTRGYNGLDAYRQSKLALIMASFDLAEELAGSGVTVNAIHPATFMDTAMVREAGGAPKSTVAEGAAAILRLCRSDDVADVTGAYFDGLEPGRALDQAYDAGARARLRAITETLIAG